MGAFFVCVAALSFLKPKTKCPHTLWAQRPCGLKGAFTVALNMYMPSLMLLAQESLSLSPFILKIIRVLFA